MMSIYSDVLVMRHPLDGSSKFAADVSSKPVINGGSGTEEHPTQAIQDLFTMRREKGKINGLTIGIVGDLKYGRTVYSLLQALGNYNVKVHLISPESLRIRTDSVYEIKKKLSFTESTNLEERIDDLDVVYVTRIQGERFPDAEEYLKVRGSYIIALVYTPYSACLKYFACDVESTSDDISSTLGSGCIIIASLFIFLSISRPIM